MKVKEYFSIQVELSYKTDDKAKNLQLSNSKSDCYCTAKYKTLT